MAGIMEGQGQLVFGLDIGTRSIVGTVGYLSGEKFHVLAQCIKEHETRAMLDGQIHDIAKVGQTIKFVKEKLENDLKMVSYQINKRDQLESILNKTFKEIEDITDVSQMTNAQLKKLIQRIEVDKDGNVDIYLKLIGDLGLDETVLINTDRT